MIEICSLNDLPENEIVKKEIENHKIILVKKNEKIYAIENLCSHMNYPLDDGDLEDFEIECLYHSARFDIRDGSAKCLPATEPIRKKLQLRKRLQLRRKLSQRRKKVKFSFKRC